MEIKKSDILKTAELVGKYADVSVDIGETLFAVYADNTKVINEFESRLVAAGMDWDDEQINGVIFLDELVNFTDHRAALEPLVNGNSFGTWVAKYTHLTLTDD
jgi:hypothetical protein